MKELEEEAQIRPWVSRQKEIMIRVQADEAEYTKQKIKENQKLVL